MIEKLSNQMSSPVSSGGAGKGPKPAKPQGFCRDFGADLSPDGATPPAPAAVTDFQENRENSPGGPATFRADSATAANGQRAYLSRKRLLELEPTLSDQDWTILHTVKACRAILGQQLGRLHMVENDIRTVNRKLKKLTDLGLIAVLNQSVNLRARGYVAYIYYLTEAGDRLLQIHDRLPEVRRRITEPGIPKLTHTVSVVECYVQTVEACRADDMALVEIQTEPECWRSYTKGSQKLFLKPDLAIVTKKQDWSVHEEPWYELRWFVEVDLNTENIQTILEKCRRYYDYYRSDQEQRLHDDVFPLAVWIVKTDGRKETLIRHIRESFPRYPRIFAVILPDEYTRLLRDELNVEDCLCPL